jgi:carbon-monoxide dehydrogenase small subunit
MKIEFVLNNQPRSINVHPARRLLDILREDFHLTSVKEGCGEGECGACVILMDGKAVNSCLVPAGNIHGKSIITLEEFKKTKRYQMIEECFLEAGSVQCGFCTPGFVMATESLLQENPRPTEAEIKAGLSGNLCRCTGYNMIIDGVKRAAERGDGLW